jgi:hypothetical protein
MRSEGDWSERHIVCLLAAVNEGSPCVADELFAAAGAGRPGTLESLLADLSKANEERVALMAWLNDHEKWKTVPTSSLAVRLETVRRLRFAPPARLR